jgi:murein tripeptide amidase MpaA
MNEHNLCFKIVPMLNPDGVIMGNYRTGVIGSDYNRLFLSAQAELFPEITALKELIK